MGLTNVLHSANSGLSVTQSSLEIVARNIANVDTPGYSKKSLTQTNHISQRVSFGVRELAVTREVDSFLQTQLRSETAAFAGADVTHDYLARVDQIFGTPGEANALDTIVNQFAASLQQLTSSPESVSTREALVGDARVLAQQLQQLTSEIQGLRQLAENSLGESVTEVNEALQQVFKINQQLGLRGATGEPNADLLDERDKFIDRIAELVEINVHERQDGTVALFTRSGNALLEGLPVQLVFDQRGDITPQSLYSGIDADRGVGTIKLQAGSGYQLDLISNGVLDSGKIGALIELRDNILVQAQAQLDELAHGLALSFSNKEVAGTAATVGAQQGFDVDTTGLQPGNAITVNFTTTPPGTAQTVSIIRVDDASQLPLSNEVTPDPNDTVIGVDFSGGIAAAAGTINAALGAGISVSSPGGNTLRFLDDGAANTSDVNSLTATITATAVQDDGLQLPLFIDGGNAPAPYSASLDYGQQKLGFAARISVNSQVVQDSELLVRHSTSPQTPLGDTARPLDMLARLTERSFSFSPASGIGQVQGPFTGSVTSFARRVVDFQGAQASQAERAKDARDLVVTGLRERFQSDTGVDVNEELSQLINLQNAFAANARVIQAIEELMRILVQI